MSYVDEVLEVIAEKNPNEPEFCQAVKECLVAQVPRGPLAVTSDGGVEGDDIAALLQLGQV